MCLFITVLLPKDADLEALKPIWEKYLMNFSPYQQDTVLSKIRPNDTCFWPGLHAHCDCSTNLGRAAKGHANDPERQSIIRQYNEQTPKPYIREKGIPAKLGEKGGPDFDIPHWIGLLSETLERGFVEHIGLFLHWGDLVELKKPSGKKERKRYKLWKKGEIRADPSWYRPVDVTIKMKRRIPLGELTVDVLALIEKDVLYEFVRA